VTVTADGRSGSPPAQHLSSEHVLDELGRHGERRVSRLRPLQILVLGVLAGGFITIGALFSVLLSDGVGSPGPARFLEGLGFSTGFFFVILSGAALFTEANVVMPATALRRSPVATGGRILRFWVLALIGNAIGAVLVAQTLNYAQHYSPEIWAHLEEVVDRKLAYRAQGDARAWSEIVVSGILANWLVGMAAFFATMGRTIIGKYIPVLLAVTAFVAANLQHSPANIAYFAIVEAAGRGPGWDVAIGWSILPAAIGNVIGGSLLVTLPFCFAALRPDADE
jgi:formate transporter